MAALIGPIVGFVLGNCSGAMITYQAFKYLDNKVTLIEGWKDRQEEFNKVIIQQIATLQALLNGRHG